MHKCDEEDALKPMSKGVLIVLLRNHSEFRRFLARRVGSDALAEDLLQQSFSKALRQPPHSDVEAGVLSWFYTILKNTLIDHYRSQAARDKTIDAFVMELEVSGANHAPAFDEIRDNLCRCMNGLLPTLKPEYAEALRAVDLNEEAPERVASRLGITIGNLNVRIHRARAALKTRLEQTCGACTEHGCLDCTCES